MPKKRNMPAALDHALYEIEMMQTSLIALCIPDMPTNYRNAWLEVFAVHVRNLNEFFGPADPGGGCMRPDHFITGWTFSYVFDKGIARRASGQVAHLTYDREKPGEKTAWPIEQIFKSLRPPCVAFLKAASSIEDLMSYHSNRVRTKVLLATLPEVRFAGEISKP